MSTPKHTPASAEKKYGAEFWVPENHMFKSGSECLEKFPDAGPACGVVPSHKLTEAVSDMYWALDYVYDYARQNQDSPLSIEAFAKIEAALKLAKGEK